MRGTMNADTLTDMLETAGEVMIQVEEFDVPLELHRHDSEIDEESITLDLADGTLIVDIDAVTGFWIHQHSLADFDLD